jgi:hypothetical protein
MSESAASKQRKTLTEWVKGVDNYGHPITLTYKNESEFKSLLGGIATLIFRIAILAYVIF